MVIIIRGDQRAIIKKRLDKVLVNSLTELNDFNVSKFDAKETPIQTILLDAEFLPFGVDKKAIVVDNAYFLSTQRNKEKIEKEQDYSSLDNYLKNQNEFIDLIFIVEADKLNSKNPVVVEATKNGQIFSIDSITKETFPSYIKKYFSINNVDIEQEAIIELAKRCENDVQTFLSNAEKLMTYSNKITIEDVESLVSKPLEDNTFLITNSLLKGDNQKAVEIYRDLLVYNEEPVHLISLIANQLKFLNQVLYLFEEGMSNQKIADELNASPIRVKIAIDTIRRFTNDKIMCVIEDLYQLDLKIKSGLIDRFYGFELFLINFKIK